MVIRGKPQLQSVRPIDVPWCGLPACSVVLSLLALGACNPSTGGALITRTVFTAEPAIETTERVVTGPPAGWRIAARPSVVIGTDDQPDESQPALALGAIRLADGRIVVADRGRNALRWYDRGGRHLFDAGREGEGPREFRYLHWIGRWRDDSIAAYDLGLRRLSIVASDGHFAWSISHSELPVLNTMGGVGMLAEGSVLAMKRLTDPIPVGGFRRRHVSLHALDVVTGEAGEFPVVWGAVSYGVEYPAYPGRYFTMPIPFEPVTEYGAGHGLLVVGETSALHLEAYNARLARLWEVSVELEPRPPTRGEQDWASRKLEFRSSDPNIQRMVRRGLREMELGSHVPAFGRWAWERVPHRSYPDYHGIVIDAERNVWVLGYVANDRDPRPWMIFSAEGRWLGQVELAKGFEPFEIGKDYVLGWREEPSGALAVVLYDILKDAAEAR